MNYRSRLLAGFVVLGLWAQAAQASRLPEPGGRADIALPAAMEDAFIRAHVSIPLVVRSVAGDGWFSESIVSWSSPDAGLTWNLLVKGDAKSLVRDLERCLSVQNASQFWPAALLGAADIEMQLTSKPGMVNVRFTRAFGPLMQLLEGCIVGSIREAPFIGPFAPMGIDALDSNLKSAVSRPLLERIVLARDGYVADLRVGAQAVDASRSVMLAPYPDVIMLLQSEEARQKDPLGLFGKGVDALDHFYRYLRTDVFVSVYAGGRGVAFRALLPPGLMQDRQLDDNDQSASPPPLRLQAKFDPSQVVSLECNPEDVLSYGFCERVAMIVRSKDFLAQTYAPTESIKPELRMVRWRSPSADPGLAMLHLLSRYPELSMGLDRDRWVRPLVHLDQAKRVEAALELEQHLMSEYRAIPLVTVDLVLDVNNGLKGVRVREDGVPLLWDAWWGSAR
jgi:hypothetical protein